MKDTKDKIIAAAYACFMEKGYTQTSVRTILENAKVTTGSFYHFFPSKEALFEAVIEVFLKDYIGAFTAICENHALPVEQRCAMLFEELAKRVNQYYGPLDGENLHRSMAYSLHEKTIAALLPSVTILLTDALSEKKLRSRLDVNTTTLSILLIRGMEAILHGSGERITGEKMECCIAAYKAYLNLLLEITPA